MNHDDARRTIEDLAEGQEQHHIYTIDDAVYGALTETFGDRSPIHVDKDVATRAGFRGRVMHGAILNGFLSHFVGMIFPGALSLLQSTELRFLAPSYIHERIRIDARVDHVSVATQSVRLAITITNLDQDVVVARGRAQIGIRASL